MYFFASSCSFFSEIYFLINVFTYLFIYTVGFQFLCYEFSRENIRCLYIFMFLIDFFFPFLLFSFLLLIFFGQVGPWSMMLIYLSAEWFIAFIIELYADGVSVRDFVLHSRNVFLSLIFFTFFFFKLYFHFQRRLIFSIAKKT